MNKIHYIYKLIFVTIAMTGLLTGCADDVHEPEGEKQLLQLIPYAKSFDEQWATTRATNSLFADGTYQKFSAMYPHADNKYAKIAIYLAKKNGSTWECKKEGMFSHSTADAWTSSVHVDPSTQYYVYGYMPTEGVNATISSGNYSQGATITMTNLSAIEPADVCVIVGVQKSNAASADLVGDIADSDIKLGSHGYLSSAENDPNYIYLLLDHIYSCINLEFAVDAEYNEVRTINLKSVKMKTSTGATNVTATITLSNSETTPMTVNLVSSGTTGTEASILTSAEGTPLTPDYMAVPGYFTPGQASLSFDVISTFDVLDKSGNVVRANCTATNKLTVNDSNNSNTPTSGKSYTIKMKVIPTYLYQLSQPDLDNPTMVIN